MGGGERRKREKSNFFCHLFYVFQLTKMKHFLHLNSSTSSEKMEELMLENGPGRLSTLLFSTLLVSSGASLLIWRRGLLSITMVAVFTKLWKNQWGRRRQLLQLFIQLIYSSWKLAAVGLSWSKKNKKIYYKFITFQQLTQDSIWDSNFLFKYLQQTKLSRFITQV